MKGLWSLFQLLPGVPVFFFFLTRGLFGPGIHFIIHFLLLKTGLGILDF